MQPRQQRVLQLVQGFAEHKLQLAVAAAVAEEDRSAAEELDQDHHHKLV
jgi:hypothetical protein